MASKNIITGFFWQYGERLTVQGISFIVTLVLARLLTPSEYGIISIANILIAILEVFVISGLGNSLVQKKDATETDFSSVFYCNFIMGVFLYLVMFVISPLCGEFYDNTQLTVILRLMSLRIIIASFDSIQRAYVQRNLLFRKLFYSSLAGTSISAILGITAAYMGFGVYALVIQYLSNSAINALALFFYIEWRPKKIFSFISVKESFNYGWKLLGSGLINTAFSELKSFVIGGKYTPADLAFYDKGKQFPSLFYNNLNTSIGSILFPVMSRSQSDVPRMRVLTKKAMGTLSIVLVPILAILFALSEPIISILLTDKWLPAVPFMEVTCVTFAFVIPNTVFTNTINSMGRSDLHLKVEIINIVSGIAILLAVMNLGTIYIALSVTASNVVCFFVRLYMVRKLCKFNFKDIWNSYIKLLILAIIVLFSVYYSCKLLQNPYLKILVGGTEGCIIFIIISRIFCNDILLGVAENIKQFKKNNPTN